MGGLCVCALPLCASSDQEEPPPHAMAHHRSTAFTSQAQSSVGWGDIDSPHLRKKPGQTPESPSPGCPSHSPIWILLGKLAPTTAPRKPVQKKAKMCCIFLFALAKKKPRSNHRFGVSPLPCIPLSVLPVLFLLQFLPSSLPSFLPSARCVFPLESKHLNCSVNTN